MPQIVRDSALGDAMAFNALWAALWKGDMRWFGICAWPRQFWLS